MSTPHHPSVRGELREMQALSDQLRAYRNRLLNSKNTDPKMLLDLEAQVTQAVSEVTARIRTLQERIAWAQFRSTQS